MYSTYPQFVCLFVLGGFMVDLHISQLVIPVATEWCVKKIHAFKQTNSCVSHICLSYFKGGGAAAIQCIHGTHWFRHTQRHLALLRVHARSLVLWLNVGGGAGGMVIIGLWMTSIEHWLPCKAGQGTKSPGK